MSVRYAARFLSPASPPGMSPAAYDRIRKRFEAAVASAARRLVRSPQLRAGLAAMGLPRGGRVVALGDSLTADPLSWAEILKQACRLGPDEVELVNLGVSGDTTVHLVSRFYDVVAHDPELLLVMVGTNDARRHGRAADRMLIPDRQTEANLALLRRLACEETRAALVLVTPPPVLENRIRRSPILKAEQVTWRESDVARKGAIVAMSHEHVIDSREALAGALDRHLLSDGLHLSLRGQERLARWILRCLTSPDSRGPIESQRLGTGGHGCTGR